MHTIKVNITALKTRTLIIGYVGENERTQVRFECEGIFDEYPHAAPSLAIKPPVGDVYPVVVSREGTDVVWDVSNADLQHEGSGELQLTFVKDGAVAKTVIGKLQISRSLLVTGEQPDVIQTWYDAATEKLAEVDAQIVELEGMVDTATDAATRAQQSESNATTAAANAATSAATATAKATEATTAAGTATAKAAEAALSATQASNSAVSAADSERGAIAKAAEAAQSAQTATAKATQATEAAQTATGKAGEASASATAAQASATNAASSATAASASETAAKASETAAGTSATQAAQSAQSANTAAQTATQKAGEAATSATNAATSATNAATSAETASTKAGEAAQSAQAVEETAEQLAESLEQIAQNTADIAEHEQYAEATYAKKTDLSNLTSDLDHMQTSGSIVETEDAFPTFAEDVTAEIVPVQDLHGYDHPWPAGGGKNLLRCTGTTETINGVTFTVNTDGTVLVNGTATETTVYSVNANARENLVHGTRYILNGSPINSDTTKWKLRIYSGGDYIDTGNGVTFQYTTTANDCKVDIVVYSGTTVSSLLFKPMIRLASETDATFAPYENICPISGFEGLTVTRTGKNLLDSSWLVNPSTYIQQVQVRLKANATYTLSTNASAPSVSVANLFLLLPGETVSSVTNGVWASHPKTITTGPEGIAIIGYRNYTGTQISIDECENQLELGDTATSYEPYNGIQVEFPFGRTVYGGQIDLTTGKLTVTHLGYTFTGNERWVKYVTQGKTTFNGGNSFPVGIDTSGECLMSRYPFKRATYISIQPDKSFSLFTAPYLSVCDNSFADATAEEFAASMAGGQLVYPLATPQVYNLTPAQVLLLRDYNVLWADTGDIINFEYRAGSFVTKKTYDALKEATLIHNTASGAIASFVDGAEMPVDEVTAQINPVQDLHGYSNPWPAGGGKNLFNIDALINTNDITIENGNILVRSTARNTTKRLKEIANLVVGETYYLSATTTSTNNFIYLYGTNNSWYFNTQRTITQQDLDSLVFLYGHSGSSDYATISSVMIRLVSDTDTTWTPYSNICPITGHTGVNVYNTTTNLYDKSANTHHYLNANGVAISNNSYRLTDYIPVDNAILIAGFNSTSSTICSAWYNANKSRLGNAFINSNGIHYAPEGAKYIRISMESSLEDSLIVYGTNTVSVSWETEAGTVYGGTLDVVRGVLTVTHGMIVSYAGETLPGEWISDRDVYAAGTTPTTGAQVVYTLAEPITYTLIPQEIRTLLGTNNIWADTGDVSVDYCADTKLYIDNKITQAIAAALNS